MSAESEAALAKARAEVDMDARNGQEGPARAAGATKMDGTGQEPIGSDRANGVAGLSGASGGSVKGQGGSSSITLRIDNARAAEVGAVGGAADLTPEQRATERRWVALSDDLTYQTNRAEAAEVERDQARADYLAQTAALDAAGVDDDDEFCCSIPVVRRIGMLAADRDSLKAALDKARADLAEAEKAREEAERRHAAFCLNVAADTEKQMVVFRAAEARADEAEEHAKDVLEANARIATNAKATEAALAAEKSRAETLLARADNAVGALAAERAALASATARVAALEADPRLGLRWGVRTPSGVLASAFLERVWASSEAGTFMNQPKPEVIDLSAAAPSRPESGADKPIEADGQPAPASDGALRRAAEAVDRIWQYGAVCLTSGREPYKEGHRPADMAAALNGLHDALRAALSASAPSEGEGDEDAHVEGAASQLVASMRRHGPKREGPSEGEPTRPAVSRVESVVTRTRWIADAALRLACADISWSPSSGDGKDNDYGPRITQEGGDDPAIARQYAEAAREILEAAERAAGEREGAKS